MKLSTTKKLITVCNAVLLDQENQIVTVDNSTNLYQELDKRLQQSYRRFYEESGMKDSINKLKGSENSDDKALKYITESASSGEGGWRATFPNLRDEGQGMDCTLASAMLHFALEDLGYDEVRSTLRPGHYVVTRLMEDGGVKIYDPATRVTDANGETSGYSRVFNPGEVSTKKVDEGIGKSGIRIEIAVDEQDLPGSFEEPEADGKYKQVFYGSPQETYLDLSVALENTDSLRQDAERTPRGSRESLTESDVWSEQARIIVQEVPEIADFDYEKLKQELKFFDPHDFVS